MTLPAEIITCNVQFGKAYNFHGDPVGVTVRVAPDRAIVWAATGDRLEPITKEVVAAENVVGQFTLPVVDQTGFVDGNNPTQAITGWYYTASVSPQGGTAYTKRFQIVTGQTSVDLDLIGDGNVTPGVTAPSASVFSVNGQTGAVSVSVDTSKFARTFPAAVDAAASNNHVPINAAIAAAHTAGGGIVDVTVPGVYITSAPIDVTSTNVTLRMARGVVIQPNYTGNGTAAISNTGEVHNLIIDGGTIRGTSILPDPAVPTRARTSSGTGAWMGINLIGAGFTTSGVTPIAPISNITVRGVRVENVGSLPLRVFGCTGRLLVDGCEFSNTMDVGFGFNSHVICVNNHSHMSADNGFSFSRGNKNLTASNNIVESCAYAGLFISGWVGDAGPDGFTITGNIVRGPGGSGIQMSDGPKNGVITGNTLYGSYLHGAADHQLDSTGAGITMSGYSVDAPLTGILIANNVIRDFAVFGIFLAQYCVDVQIRNNLIRNIGTQYLSDGVTPIAANNTAYNVAIALYRPDAPKMSNIVVEGNSIADTRSTPYTNYAVDQYPSAALTFVDNLVSGMRSAPSAGLQRMMQSQDLALPAGAHETIPRYACTLGTIACTSGAIRWAFFTAQEADTVTTISAMVGTTAAAATPTLVRAGLYTWVAGTGLTLVASSASDTTALASASAAQNFALTAPYTLIPGRRYGVGVLVISAATVPTLYGVTAGVAAVDAVEPRISGTTTGHSDLPSTIAYGSLTSSTNIPYFRVY